jgi:hypothetical protein
LFFAAFAAVAALDLGESGLVHVLDNPEVVGESGGPQLSQPLSQWNQADNDIIKAENDRLHASLVELLYKNGLINSEFKALKDEDTKLKTKDTWLKTRIASLLKSSDQVKELTKQVRQTQKENDKLVVDNQDLEEAKTGFKSRIAKVESQLELEKEISGRNTKNFQDKLEDMTWSLQQAERRLSSRRLNASFAESRIAELSSIAQNTKHLYETKEMRLGVVQERFHKEQEKVKAELIAEREKDNKIHEQKMSMMNETAKVAYLSKQRTSLLKSNTDLQAKVAALTSRSRRAGTLQGKLRQENTKLEVQMKKMQAKLDAAARIKADADEKTAKAKAREAEEKSAVKAKKVAEIKAKTKAIAQQEEQRRADEDAVDADNVIQAAGHTRQSRDVDAARVERALDNDMP